MLVCEGANMPCMPGAVECFLQNKLLYGPGKAANAGGVATSGLEMSQNAMRITWPREEVDTRLKNIMIAIHDNCFTTAEQYGEPGNYVAGATANAGLTATGTEGATLGIALTASGNTGSSSSNSGLEVGSAGLTLLKGCDDNQILKYTDASGWACAADGTGGTVNSFATISAPAGTSPVADSSTDTLALSVTGTNLTLTGSESADSLTFDVVESVLAGDGLTVSSDALAVNVGSGTQIVSDAVALGPLTANWDQTGAFDLLLHNAAAEIQILESDGDTFYGTLDVGNLAGAATYTFSGATGTVLTSANAATELSAWDQTASDDLTTANYTTTLNDVYVNVDESPAGAGDISGTFTAGLTIDADSVVLGTDTTGNYVAGATANYGLTLTGTEGGTLGITLTSSGNTGSSSSNSGLEVGSAGLTLLKGCDDNQILKYTDAGGWACAADGTGGTVNSFATISAPAGTSPVADSSTDTLALSVTGTTLTITGS